MRDVREKYISRHEYLMAKEVVRIALGISTLKAELWLDAATNSLLQYYLSGMGHPTSAEGERLIRLINGEHGQTIVKALSAKRITNIP